jgi:hypothetical protein
MESRRIARGTSNTLMLFLVIALFVSGCQNSNAIRPTMTDEAPATALQAPTSTVTSTPDAVVFVKSEAAAESSQQAEVETLEKLTLESGFVFHIVQIDELETSLSKEPRLVVSTTPIEDIERLAQENPGTGFIVPGVTESSLTNLWMVRPLEDLNAQVGFISGYIAALLTPDYRVGGIAVNGDGRENAAIQGFLNGAVFYCGLCRATYPPFYDYPQSVLATSTEPNDVLSSVQQLLDLGVTTIYLSPRLSNQNIYDALQTSSARYIGSASPISLVGNQWVATIVPDEEAALREAWEAWLADEPGYIVNPPLSLREIDEELITPGKLEYLENVLFDLSSGRIDPAVDPQTGESK